MADMTSETTSVANGGQPPEFGEDFGLAGDKNTHDAWAALGAKDSAQEAVPESDLVEVMQDLSLKQKDLLAKSLMAATETWPEKDRVALEKIKARLPEEVRYTIETRNNRMNDLYRKHINDLANRMKGLPKFQTNHSEYEAMALEEAQHDYIQERKAVGKKAAWEVAVKGPREGESHEEYFKRIINARQAEVKQNGSDKQGGIGDKGSVKSPIESGETSKQENKEGEKEADASNLSPDEPEGEHGETYPLGSTPLLMSGEIHQLLMPGGPEALAGPDLQEGKTLPVKALSTDEAASDIVPFLRDQVEAGKDIQPDGDGWQVVDEEPLQYDEVASVTVDAGVEEHETERSDDNEQQGKYNPEQLAPRNKLWAQLETVVDWFSRRDDKREAESCKRQQKSEGYLDKTFEAQSDGKTAVGDKQISFNNNWSRAQEEKGTEENHIFIGTGIIEGSGFVCQVKSNQGKGGRTTADLIIAGYRLNGEQAAKIREILAETVGQENADIAIVMENGTTVHFQAGPLLKEYRRLAHNLGGNFPETYSDETLVVYRDKLTRDQLNLIAKDNPEIGRQGGFKRIMKAVGNPDELMKEAKRQGVDAVGAHLVDQHRERELAVYLAERIAAGGDADDVPVPEGAMKPTADEVAEQELKKSRREVAEALGQPRLLLNSDGTFPKPLHRELEWLRVQTDIIRLKHEEGRKIVSEDRERLTAAYNAVREKREGIPPFEEYRRAVGITDEMWQEGDGAGLADGDRVDDGQQSVGGEQSVAEPDESVPVTVVDSESSDGDNDRGDKDKELRRELVRVLAANWGDEGLYINEDGTFGTELHGELSTLMDRVRRVRESLDSGSVSQKEWDNLRIAFFNAIQESYDVNPEFFDTFKDQLFPDGVKIVEPESPALGGRIVLGNESGNATGEHEDEAASHEQTGEEATEQKVDESLQHKAEAAVPENGAREDVHVVVEDNKSGDRDQADDGQSVGGEQPRTGEDVSPETIIAEEGVLSTLTEQELKDRDAVRQRAKDAGLNLTDTFVEPLIQAGYSMEALERIAKDFPDKVYSRVLRLIAEDKSSEVVADYLFRVAENVIIEDGDGMDVPIYKTQQEEERTAEEEPDTEADSHEPTSEEAAKQRVGQPGQQAAGATEDADAIAGVTTFTEQVQADKEAINGRKEGAEFSRSANNFGGTAPVSDVEGGASSTGQRLEKAKPEASPQLGASEVLAAWKEDFNANDYGLKYFIDPEGLQTPEQLLNRAREAGYPSEYLGLLAAYLRGGEGIEEDRISRIGGLREAAKQAKARAEHLREKDQKAAARHAAQKAAQQTDNSANSGHVAPTPEAKSATVEARSGEGATTSGHKGRILGWIQNLWRSEHGGRSKLLISSKIEKMRKKGNAEGLRGVLGDNVSRLEDILQKEREERNSEIVSVPNIPTVVVGDIHARPYAIPNALINAMKELTGNAGKSDEWLLNIAKQKIADGKLAIVLLGDYAHSEHKMERWTDMTTNSGRDNERAIVEELAGYTQVISQLLTLKELAASGDHSENVVILRGNHDDITNTNIAKGVYKNDGSERVVAQAALWIGLCVKDSKLAEKIEAFENSLPLMAYNKKHRIVWAHDVPNINEEKLQRLKEKAGYGKQTSKLVNWTNFSRDLYGGESVPSGVHDKILKILKNGLFSGQASIVLEVGHTAGEQEVNYSNGRINTLPFGGDDAGVNLHHFDL